MGFFWGGGKGGLKRGDAYKIMHYDTFIVTMKIIVYV